MRHGNRNIVEKNVFIGNHKPNTGGIRVVNADQIIRDNYLENLTGKRFYAALAVMNSVPNPLPNRYHQVDNALIENNTFVRCEHIEFGVGADFERIIPPINSVVKNNIFYYPEKQTVFEAHTDISGISFVDNKYVASVGDIKTSGFQDVKMEAVPTYTLPVEKSECGASWFSVVFDDKKETENNRVVVDIEQNSLVEAVKKANCGDTIILKNNSVYLIDKTVDVDKIINIFAENTEESLPEIRYNGTKGRVSMITIADNGHLSIKGLRFNGSPYQGNSRPMSGISPASKMAGTYTAQVANCVFESFEESSFAGFKALKNSFADRLQFSECTFQNISGEGIGLAAEKNDDGRYSAENIIIENCTFNNILGCAINVYRGGTDESMAGPSLVVNSCTFNLCNNQERGAALRLIGVQVARLDNLKFVDSGRGGVTIKFDECRWDDILLSNIHYQNSGGLRMNALYK